MEFHFHHDLSRVIQTHSYVPVNYALLKKGNKKEGKIMANSSDIILVDGEKVVVTLQTEMYAQSANIVANIIAKVFGFVSMLLGCKSIGQLTITDRRIILEQHQKIFWCFDTKAAFYTIMPNSIATVDYAFVGQVLCLCRKYVFSFSTTSMNLR